MSGLEGNNGHHRKQRANGGTDGPENMSRVEIKAHNAWHYLFGNLAPVGVAVAINKLWIEADWRLVAISAETFMFMLQYHYWFQARKDNKQENMDGDGI